MNLNYKEFVKKYTQLYISPSFYPEVAEKGIVETDREDLFNMLLASINTYATNGVIIEAGCTDSENSKIIIWLSKDEFRNKNVEQVAIEAIDKLNELNNN